MGNFPGSAYQGTLGISFLDQSFTNHIKIHTKNIDSTFEFKIWREKGAVSLVSTQVRLVQVQGEALLVANAGDSRCVVSEAGKAVAMSFDHKPTDAAEHSRIIKVSQYPSMTLHQVWGGRVFTHPRCFRLSVLSGKLDTI